MNQRNQLVHRAKRADSAAAARPPSTSAARCEAPDCPASPWRAASRNPRRDRVAPPLPQHGVDARRIRVALAPGPALTSHRDHRITLCRRTALDKRPG
jgi:hypothetical protein